MSSPPKDAKGHIASAPASNDAVLAVVAEEGGDQYNHDPSHVVGAVRWEPLKDRDDAGAADAGVAAAAGGSGNAGSVTSTDAVRRRNTGTGGGSSKDAGSVTSTDTLRRRNCYQQSNHHMRISDVAEMFSVDNDAFQAYVDGQTTASSHSLSSLFAKQSLPSASASAATSRLATPSSSYYDDFGPTSTTATTSDDASVGSTSTTKTTTKDRIRLGICAMDKKARSKPMAEILKRLDKDLFDVVFFGDELILEKPIEVWPVCDVLIAFFSKGYPLQKVKTYVALTKPFILNDLDQQELLQDRRRVYDLLQASGIDVPRHAYLSRDDYKSTGTGDGNRARDQEPQEFDDHIVINGITINKPFVEKPVNAEDHNIAIYYPTSAGGGCKKLFRKIGNRSSEFYPDINEVRRDGSYIYEEFVETQGTDVKMYTVGPEYGHAEARKSPAVDGKVQRNAEGKEVRFPVILTFREKEIARRIVLVFKQFVCGFDILRVQEGHSVVSYVCDVNGWSFVKNSRKYYDDCAQVLSEHILALARPAALKTISTLDPLVTTSMNHADEEIAEAIEDAAQPMHKKFLSHAARMLRGNPSPADEKEMTDAEAEGAVHLNNSPSRSETDRLLLNAAATLSDGAVPVREFPDNLTSEPASLVQSSNSSYHGEEIEEDGVSGSTSGQTFGDRRHLHLRRRHRAATQTESTHQEELRCVLTIVRHGDRTPKQKLKVNMSEPHILAFFHKHSDDCTKELKVKAKAPMTEFLEMVKTTLRDMSKASSSSVSGAGGDGSDKKSQSHSHLRYQIMHMRDILERWKIVGLNRKLQIKPRSFEDYVDPETGETCKRCTEVQLILKWGGNLTKLGEKQAIALGHRHRHEMYPDAPGGGILRLHSTFRHDLKIKTSDEGRVMKTAAAFAKGLLELEGDLPPILVSLVHKEKGSMHMLDPSGNKEVKMELDECKEKITANLQRDINVETASEEDLEQLVGPRELTGLRTAIRSIGNPRKTLIKIHETMGELIAQLEEMLEEMGSGDEKLLQEGQSEDDLALSGVKLYKGETLLELTERWRFIYDRLYDAEKDQFDLSRIPDVHDNARFDVLHNPHLGLSNILGELYQLAKNMADCVVPQEYGTTIAEKASVGAKICLSLLDKIKYDLSVAKTDNEVDMRYLVDMRYAADLPINTLGRRIRTRLYFTSESHLHTVLNVLRFAQCENSKPMLSEHGTAIVNATQELCYLTQIVIRVFEDSRRDESDPRRFRVEILFSPGATANPRPPAKNEDDASRLETAPLQLIGREGLACAELEDFFEHIIVSGRTEEEGTNDAASTSTLPEVPKKSLKKKKKKNESVANAPDAMSDIGSLEGLSSDLQTTAEASGRTPVPAVVPVDTVAPSQAPPPVIITSETINSPEETKGRGLLFSSDEGGEDDEENKDKRNAISAKEKNAPSRSTLTRKYFWSTVAVASFGLGIACFVMALNTSGGGGRRRWPTGRR